MASSPWCSKARSARAIPRARSRPAAWRRWRRWPRRWCGSAGPKVRLQRDPPAQHLDGTVGFAGGEALEHRPTVGADHLLRRYVVEVGCEVDMDEPFLAGLRQQQGERLRGVAAAALP